MPLDPQVQSVLALMAKRGSPLPENLPVAENRRLLRNVVKLSGPPEPVAEVHDARAGDVGLRIYVPGVGAAPRPVLVFFHGGGWVLGDLDSHDPVCRVLANRAGAVVVAVDYRLAPEHPFPAAVDDAVTALNWVHEHVAGYGGDPARLAVGGDSAGGNLAAVLARHARDHGPELRFQLLAYPAVDVTDTSPSMSENADGPILTVASVAWFLDHYLPLPGDRTDPRMSPALAGNPAGLPPALVVTAEFDPLRDQGAAYAAALSDAGVAARHRPSPGMVHGFLQFGGMVDGARAALDDMGAALRDALA